MRIYLSVFLLLILATSAIAQQKKTVDKLFEANYKPAEFSDPARLEKIRLALPAIDQIYREHAEKNHFPGMAYAIMVDGKIVHTGNIGYTDIEKKIPVTSSSIFRIASMSKSFTAMAILKLRDEGKLRLDDPARFYIPEMGKLKYLTADSEPITIRNLLTHGAGFPEDNPWGDRQLADSDKELTALIKGEISFSNPPGVEYEYSNLGFALLGRIVTKVSGKPYQQYIRENIWKPLGMKTTEWEYANVSPDKLAHGYRWLYEKWNEETLLHDKPDGSWGAMGGMLTSIEEFSRYMALHLSAWPPSSAVDNGPIKRNSVREMHYPWRFIGLNTQYAYWDGRKCPTASAYAYGLGWLRDCEGRVYIGHGGGLPGFGSHWRIMPEYGIGIVAFANVTYASNAGVNLRVLDTIIKSADLKPRQLPASPILNQRRAELMKCLPTWENAETGKIFAENFFTDNPVELLRKNWSDIYAKAGKIIGVKDMVPENQLRGRFIIEGEKIDIEVFFTLSPENPPLIQQLEMREIAKK